MKRSFAPWIAVALIALVVGCAPAPAAPTAAPAKPAAPAPTAAPAAAPKVEFPEKGKSISVIIPWPAGGSTDIGARVIAPSMEKTLGVPLTLLNKGGAGSQVGVTDLAKSKPDGYTIGWTNMPSSMSPYLDPSRGAQYGRKDLMQVANVVVDPEVAVVTTESPYKSLKDVIEAAKAKPDTVKASVTGIGSDNHLAVLMLQELTGAKFNIVNFDGGAPSMTALFGGHVDVNFQTLGNYPSHLKSGKIRILGIMEDQRVKLVPDVPTFTEQGYKISYASSRGVSVPAGTPKEIVDILANSIKKGMEDPAVAKKFDEMLLATKFLGPAEYTAYWDQFEKQTKPILDRVLVKK